MIRTLSKLSCVLLTVTLAGLAGCEDTGIDDTGTPSATETDEFRNALPTVEQLELSVPEAGTVAGGLSDAGDGSSMYQGALVGELSEYYEFTRDTTWGVNGFLMAILGPIDWITENLEPTVRDGNVAVWMGSEPLDPQDHLLAVERHDDGHYEYIVLAKLKDPADADWRVRVAGTYTPNGVPDNGHGSVWVDLDTDLDENTTGKVLFLWAALQEEHTVTAYLYEASGDLESEPADSAVYHYERYADASGLFMWAVEGFDLNEGEPGKEALEDAAVISRWNADGAGRADLVATGGDIAAEGYDWAVHTQCWVPDSFQTGFESLFVVAGDDEPIPVSVDGDFAECAYEDIPEVNLPELPDEPEADELPDEALE